jgi:hypothetical protein
MTTYSVYRKAHPGNHIKSSVNNIENGYNGRLFLLENGQTVYGNFTSFGRVSAFGDGYLGEGYTHDELTKINSGDIHKMAELYKQELLKDTYVIVEHDNPAHTKGKLLSNKDIGLE